MEFFFNIFIFIAFFSPLIVVFFGALNIAISYKPKDQEIGLLGNFIYFIQFLALLGAALVFRQMS
jgi:predicted membrane metal-binding protein